MSKTKSGVLITTDEVTKYYLTTIPDIKRFLIKDIDECSIFVHDEIVARIKEEAIKFKNKNSYEEPIKKVGQ